MSIMLYLFDPKSKNILHDVPCRTVVVPIEDEEKIAELEAEGWAHSPKDAKENGGKAKADKTDKNNIPSREELEEKAKSLGVEFDDTVKDNALFNKIKKALKEQENKDGA